MSTSTSDNNSYPEICELAATTYEYFATFKRDSRYTAILEHVSGESGLEYYQNSIPLIKENILKFSINDSIGSPGMCQYDFGIFSPTTLRYAKILGDLSQLKLDGIRIVEVGCGYGGQYTVLRQLFKPAKYTFVDLKEPLMLIEKYVKELKLDDIELNFVSPDKTAATESDLFISNYAFSECHADIQDIYIENYINNAKRGYMIYNNFNGYSHEEFCKKVKKKVKVFKEIPNTYEKNVLLAW